MMPLASCMCGTDLRGRTQARSVARKVTRVRPGPLVRKAQLAQLAHRVPKAQPVLRAALVLKVLLVTLVHRVQ